MTDTSDYEKALLGTILSGYQRGIPDLARMITSADFYQPAHEVIWDAVLRVFNSGGAPDPLTVRSALGEWANKLPGGPVYLAELTEAAGPSIMHYAEKVKAGSVFRRLHDVSMRIDQLAEKADGDPDEVINDAAAQLDALRNDRPGTGSVTIGQVLPEVIDIAQNGRAKGMSTPWPDIDRYLRGLHAGRVYVVGARPGIGKSLFGLNVATHFSTRHGLASFVASLEMGADELTQRALAATSRVDLGHLDTGSLNDAEWGRVADAMVKLQDAPILINDDPGQTIADIRASAQDAARRHNLGLIVVDYLQLVRPADRRMPREQQVADLSRGLKRLARELRVPVIALAQVNRAATSRSDAHPRIDDLRESGSIEADADVVILLHTDPDIPEIVEVDIPKNRSGPKGKAELLIFGHYGQLASTTT